jgi:cytochrome c oxidase cbb3-type subunit 3
VSSAGKAMDTIIALLLAVLASSAGAQDTKESVNRETSKPAVRGGLVFKTYCQGCHGERGDGLGHANMAIERRSSDYYEKIIRRGGGAQGRSSGMPSWQEELSKEQITDVVAYVAIVGDSVRRGEAVYKTNCILCHGIQGDGRGRAATLFHPPPADLTRSDKSDEYKTAIIRRGGLLMGRSSGMPPWQERLSDIEIRDVVGYLRTLLVPPPKL